MAQGFQQKSEAALNKLFGTTSGKKIWDTWKQETKKDEKAVSKKTSIGGILKFPDGSTVDIESSGLSDAEIKAAIKAGAKKQ